MFAKRRAAVKAQLLIGEQAGHSLVPNESTSSAGQSSMENSTKPQKTPRKRKSPTETESKPLKERKKMVKSTRKKQRDTDTPRPRQSSQQTRGNERRVLVWPPPSAEESTQDSKVSEYGSTSDAVDEAVNTSSEVLLVSWPCSPECDDRLQSISAGLLIASGYVAPATDNAKRLPAQRPTTASPDAAPTGVSSSDEEMKYDLRHVPPSGVFAIEDLKCDEDLILDSKDIHIWDSQGLESVNDVSEPHEHPPCDFQPLLDHQHDASHSLVGLDESIGEASNPAPKLQHPTPRRPFTGLIWKGPMTFVFRPAVLSSFGHDDAAEQGASSSSPSPPVDAMRGSLSLGQLDSSFSESGNSVQTVEGWWSPVPSPMEHGASLPPGLLPNL